MNNINSSKYPDYLPNNNNFSPINTPIHKRIETFCTLIHSSSIILLPSLYFYLWTKIKLWPILTIYVIYSYLLDNTTITGDSIFRESFKIKNLFIYKGFIDYFPIITHRTIKLPPSIKIISKKLKCLPEWTKFLPKSVKKLLKILRIINERERIVNYEEHIGPRYMFVCHPHGVISFGITGSLCWNGIDKIFSTGKLKSSKSFKSLFNGIPCHLLTLSAQLILPFYRDYIMSLGVGLVTKKSILSILQKWHSVAIVVGGAHESLLAKPGMNKIVLNKRKGFIKIALESCNLEEQEGNDDDDNIINDNIQNGKWDEKLMSDIAIVPVYVYGENNIHNVYNTTEHSIKSKQSRILRFFLKFQLILKKFTGFTLPLVNSRSIFNYDFGLLPYRRKIDIVFGEPIYIYRKFGNKVGDKVTNEEIEFYHKLYKDRLIELWEKNKSFATEWDEPLQIVE